MTPAPVSAETLAELATTRPAPAGAAALRAALHARRMLLLKAALVRVERARTALAPGVRTRFEADWALLERAERADPAAVRDLLDYPMTGAWLGAVLAADEGPELERHLPYITGLALSAAVRSGCPVEGERSVPSGRLVLPGLGVLCCPSRRALLDGRPGSTRITDATGATEVLFDRPGTDARRSDGGGAGWPGADSRRRDGEGTGRPGADTRRPDGGGTGGPGADTCRSDGDDTGRPGVATGRRDDGGTGRPGAGARRPDGDDAGRLGEDTRRPHGGGTGWLGLRALPGSAVLLDDLDPYRVPVHGIGPEALPAARRPDSAPGAWAARWVAARDLLSATDPARAAETSEVLRAVVPLAPSGHTGGPPMSATLRAAPGALLSQLPQDAGDLAETLVHESQHTKLATLHELVPLYRPGGARHRVGWRPDPRPVPGVLQGVYAHLALADLWRRARDGSLPDHSWRDRAERQFDTHWDQVGKALSILRESDELTFAGREFVQEMERHHARLGVAARSPG
ncbi:HEXXH motif-containing putative peptide modification protein [Streptomyces sp. NPDC001792]|uniref:aKG-HExxH-type peptide beta-hydroxylase n=1 Tax=Streptomyces sp. NPDC001792 TaxID=3154524 RepID=UPI003319ABEE